MIFQLIQGVPKEADGYKTDQTENRIKINGKRKRTVGLDPSNN